uniref:Multiple C2 domains, transmembrane 1b n=1 Tax=Myripristis murdjan TaxID=586833 RepID=A0A667XRB3_9TELE
MERSEEGENESSSSHQNTMWKQFQAKAKPLLSPKLGARDSDDKKERGMWMFKKKKKRHVVLDRVISSSQPDLLFSSPVDLDVKEAQLCGKADSGGPSRDKLQPGKRRSTSPNKPTVAQLVQSHHKSSSLGSACLEALEEPPVSGGGGEAAADAAEAQLERKEEQPVRLYSVK